jgi:hypothetical protein
MVLLVIALGTTAFGFLTVGWWRIVHGDRVRAAQVDQWRRPVGDHYAP